MARGAGRARGRPRASGEVELARATWALGICSGALGELAEQLAVDAAAEASLRPPEVPPADLSSFAAADVGRAALERRRAATERIVADAVTDARVAREVEAHRFPWSSVDCLLFVHPDFDVLREAALCLTEDGLELDTVARDAGAELRRSRLVLGELPPEVGTRLFAAEPGELVGPLAAEETGWLALVEAKTTPSAADPALRERAAELIAARERARFVDEWVRWHERL